ncbi:mitochondrial ornithine transporter 1-like isoform X2 [Lithobates pipiens]
MSPDAGPANPLTEILINVTSGAMGGVACVLSGQPFDTAKVKMQTFPSMYRNFLDCTVRTYRSEGLRGLYHGTIPALVANVAENAVLFACYGFCQNLVSYILGFHDLSQLRDHHKAAAGSLASVFSSLVLCPTELVKCRMQTQHEMRVSGRTGIPYKSTPWSIVRDILKSEGAGGLFRGLSSTWLREIPGSCSGHGQRWCGRSLFLAVCVSGGLGEVQNPSPFHGIPSRGVLPVLAAHTEERRNLLPIQRTDAYRNPSVPLQRRALPGL